MHTSAHLVTATLLHLGPMQNLMLFHSRLRSSACTLPFSVPSSVPLFVPSSVRSSMPFSVFCSLRSSMSSFLHEFVLQVLPPTETR
ncbi:hypothetical protein PoB_001886600 [Plakobranchus ocellatus]|uniref:Secreted protein n=1 Tax=Plakobranchus ocellatus TaxID=259542 RepID=A0AAV3YZ70_9GAST|nr:hypothetical protein PoB_001886600 [Plakobranchus ocellatus]